MHELCLRQHLPPRERRVRALAAVGGHLVVLLPLNERPVAILSLDMHFVAIHRVRTIRFMICTADRRLR